MSMGLLYFLLARIHFVLWSTAMRYNDCASLLLPFALTNTFSSAMNPAKKMRSPWRGVTGLPLVGTHSLSVSFLNTVQLESHDRATGLCTQFRGQNLRPSETDARLHA